MPRNSIGRDIKGRLAGLTANEWIGQSLGRQHPFPFTRPTWLVMGGRGSGKTRVGAEWVNALVRGFQPFTDHEHRYHRIALIGETLADVREVMVEGPSGIIAHARGERPRYEPSRRRLVWKSGAVAMAFSSEDPESLRGPQFEAAWCDEFAKWKNVEACFDMLQFGLRLGDRPVQLITTTPRPLPILKRLIADEAVTVTTLRPWRSQIVMASPEDSGFSQRQTLAAAATMGRLAEEAPAGFEGRLDHGGRISVLLFEGALVSVSMAQMLNGTNAAAIRSNSGAWEVVQFLTVDEVAPSLWELGGLLRGQLGTGDAMVAGASKGADFVLLDEAVKPAGLKVSETGAALNWRVVPSGADIAGASFAAATETGGVRSLLPLSPVHLGLRRLPSGDAVLSWIRRGRVDADSWMGEEIPLGEAGELYRLEISAPGGETLRMVEVASPSHVYTLAQMTADFGTVPDEIELTVRQVSQAVGPGIAANATLALQ